MEISAPGVTKAATLSMLADELGVPASDVVAFGDMPNDLPMLEWAGTAYAMANADPLVLAAADHVAPANDEDGVARVLTRFTACDRIGAVRRLLVVLLLGLMTVVVVEGSAHAACTCKQLSLPQKVNKATGVFSGTLSMASGPTTIGQAADHVVRREGRPASTRATRRSPRRPSPCGPTRTRGPAG